MTVKEIAREYGVSRQTVYQRVKTAGLQMDRLTDNGQLTVDGINAIRDLLNGHPVKAVKDADGKVVNNGQPVTDNQRLRDLVADLQNKVVNLEEQVRQLEIKAARVPDLERHCQYLETQLAESIASTRQAVKRLPSGRGDGDHTNGSSFLQRLRGIFGSRPDHHDHVVDAELTSKNDSASE